MKDDEIENAKEVEYYSAMVNAWLNTAMELDKSILTLSAGGIGLLIAFQKDFDISNIYLLLLYIFCTILFLISLILTLFIFQKNKGNIEEVIKNRKEQPSLYYIDIVLHYIFGLALILTATLSIILTIETFNKKEVKMNNEKVQQDSISGIENLRPCNESFSGISVLNQSQEPTKKPDIKPTEKTPVTNDKK